MSDIKEGENLDNGLISEKKAFYKRPYVIGAFLGAIAGYIYYAQVGCLSGTCPLTSNPWFTVAWGAVLGYLMGDMLNKKPGKKKQ